MKRKGEHNEVRFSDTHSNDEGFLNDTQRKTLQMLREWMDNAPVPEFDIEAAIEKMYQTPLILNMDRSESKEEETSTKEKVERIIKQEIIPDLKMLSLRRGQNASEVIKKAKRSVRVTHFSKESLPDEYILRLVALLEQGITVTRIAYFHENYLHNYRWLKSFRKNGELLPGYTELVHKGEPTPMELVIVDDREVLLSFPIHHEVEEFFDAVVIKESGLVRAFRTVFSLLELNSMETKAAQDYTSLRVPEYLKLRKSNLRIINKRAV